MSEVNMFGIKMIYPTNTGPKCANPWFLGIDDWESRVDNWVGEQSINDDGNLQFNVKLDGDDIKTRFKIQALPGQDEVTETRQDILRDRGFMGTERDWKNVEVTFYARIKQKTNSNNNGGPHLEIEARSGVHTGTDNRVCEGTALHTNVYPSGRVKLEKELSHTKGYTENDPDNDNATNNLMDRWFGMKGIFYNTRDNNVKIELWLDENANNDWGNGPVLEKLDDGGWFIEQDDRPNECGGEDDEKIIWGGPIIILRSDELKDFDLKCVSVREIIPPN